MSTIKADNIATLAGVSTSMANAVNGSAKAWVNFDGTFGTSPFTVANGGIRRAFNVSSITDNGTGDYTVNFTTAMVDADYGINVLGCPATTTTDAGSVLNAKATMAMSAPASDSLRIRAGYNYYTASAFADWPFVFVSIFS